MAAAETGKGKHPVLGGFRRDLALLACPCAMGE
jgi:hypothetical protein